MSIFLANLALNPTALQKGVNTVNFTYDGSVDSDDENPVTLTFSIAAKGGEVEIVPGGLSTTFPPENFPLQIRNLSGSVTINVITDQGGNGILDATLTGVDNGGSSASATNSFTY